MSVTGDDISWKELRRAAVKTDQILRLELMVVHQAADSYSSFIALVNRAIDYCMSRLTAQRNNFGSMDEDQLTSVVTEQLRALGFDAWHDANVGGHCDITIEGPDSALWLGEAKIYSGGAYLFKGVRQLVDRYMPGLAKQDQGSLIIYLKRHDALAIMKKWRATLLRRVAGIISPEPGDQELHFETGFRHAASGRDIKIRHVCAVLFQDPTENLGMTSGKIGLH